MEVASKADYVSLSTESFANAIRNVLSDPKYSINVKKISKLFQDKPKKSLDTAVWYTEFVMRNPNLDNLKSPTLQLGPFASKSYDVLLVVIIFLHIIVYFLCKIIKGLANLFGKSNKSATKAQKKRQ